MYKYIHVCMYIHVHICTQYIYEHVFNPKVKYSPMNILLDNHIGLNFWIIYLIN